MLDYKKIAIKNFKKANYDEALKYFSLAYELKNDNDLLTYIELCVFAKTSPDEANVLFEMFYAKQKAGIKDDGLTQLLALLQNKHFKNEAIEEQDAITYDDFLNAVKQGDFKSVFENIMFSTKVMISNKDDFLDFISNLIKHDFLDISMSYLESAATMFSGDERIARLFDELKKKRVKKGKNANLH
ncbi:histidine kinase [Campylobacter gastrosuis]|uniref:Histidine kinase n=1 Tax=Campylobacter gastrosuis TaxID=2974576 RepID=A0ABT7HRK7_9BACT|nr:histidine kinase [Campylobacter gastrosuis]MDL0089048.1 histidine kinase [Campylobacter gastrosuis]